jgi:hypothetical protein
VFRAGGEKKNAQDGLPFMTFFRTLLLQDFVASGLCCFRTLLKLADPLAIALNIRYSQRFAEDEAEQVRCGFTRGLNCGIQLLPRLYKAIAGSDAF